MSEVHEKRLLIEQLRATIEERLPVERRAATSRFVEAYYRGADGEDLAERDLESIYGAALAHLRLALGSDLPAIRVYNPQLDQHGWQSTHTVMQLVVDDMPFLVDSVQMAIAREGLMNHLVIHPVMEFICDGQGRPIELIGLSAPGGSPGRSRRLAIMHFEVDRVVAAESLKALAGEIASVLADVAAAVADWPRMLEKVAETIAELDSCPPGVAQREGLEARAFLDWLTEDQFTFLGYREYHIEDKSGAEIVRVGRSGGLGVLRGDAVDLGTARVDALRAAMLRTTSPERGILTISKAHSPSRVHRAGYMDYVGVTRWSEDGQRVIGERRFVGLYTSEAYHRSPRFIPVLRRKVEEVLAAAAFPKASHAGKNLLNVLENFPRDVLFQVGPGELSRITTSILHLQERPRVRLFIHPDPYGRFYGCIVYVPRDRFNTEIRLRIQDILSTALGGELADFNLHLSDAPLTRVYVVIRTPEVGRVEFDLASLPGK